MFISSPRTPWPTAPTCATSARTTTAARRLIPRSSANCSARCSRTRITRRTCWRGRWRRWTGSLRRWAPRWKSAAAPTPRGLPTRTLLTCPPWRPSCGPARNRTRSRNTSMRISAPRPRQLLSGQGNEARLRRSLAEDLNGLLERELKIKERLKAKKREKDAVDQEIADGSTSERLRKKQEQLGGRDRRAVQDRPAVRAGAFQAGAAFGIPGRLHQGESAELDPHPAEPAAAGSGLPEGNRPEPGRGLPGPRNLHGHARGFAALLPGIHGRRPAAHAGSTS